MRFLYFILILFITPFCFSNNTFHKCKLLFTNGNIVEGYAQMPTNISMDDKIKFKASLNLKDVKKVDRNRLEEIIYYVGEKNRPIFFINSKFYKSYLDDKQNIKTKLFRPYWLLRSYTNDKLIVYTLSENYRFEKGKLSSYSSGQLGLGDYSIIYLLQRPEERYPSMISFQATGYVTNGDKFFKRVAIAYFKDEKDLLKRIKKDEFGLETYDALIRAYCQCNYRDNFYIHY